MSVRDNLRWKQWAERLRQELMRELTPEITKSIVLLIEETGTDKSPTTLHSQRFWQSCQAAKPPNDVIAKAGFEISFQTTEKNRVDAVTLRLNPTWSSILQRVVDRRPVRGGQPDASS